MGRYLVRRTLFKVPVLFIVSLLTFVAIANLCVDVAYAFLDPRVRYQ